MKSFTQFIAENVVNVGSAKWPLYAKKTTKLPTKHEDGSTHKVDNYKEPSDGKGDHIIHHGGETYTYTGKSGKRVKTGERAHEYSSSEDRRVWVSKSGHVQED